MFNQFYHFEQQVRTSTKDEVEQLCDKFLSDNDEVPEYFFDRWTDTKYK